MIGSILVMAAMGQFYGGGFYGRTPLPLYDPAGYQLRYGGHGWVNGPFAPPVGNPRVIELPGIEQVGEVKAVDYDKQLITLRLPMETVLVHYGSRTWWDGTYEDVQPGTLLSINESKHRITILGGQSGSRKLRTPQGNFGGR